MTLRYYYVKSLNENQIQFYEERHAWVVSHSSIIDMTKTWINLGLTQTTLADGYQINDVTISRQEQYLI